MGIIYLDGPSQKHLEVGWVGGYGAFFGDHRDTSIHSPWGGTHQQPWGATGGTPQSAGADMKALYGLPQFVAQVEYLSPQVHVGH